MNNTLPRRSVYARLIKSSTTTRASYYVPLNDHFTDHYTHHTLHTPPLLRYSLHLYNLHVGTLHLHDNFSWHTRNRKLYIWLECPEGTLAVWGDVLLLKNKLLITIKRFLFTALKNINHSQSYEQSKNSRSITNLSQHVHVRVTMYPLTTISYITYSVVNTPMYLIAICTWAPLISMVIFRYTHEIANYIYD